MSAPGAELATLKPPSTHVPMTLTNLFYYISFTSPILVIFFITLFSIMVNNFAKGLIFNMGIVIVAVIVCILKNTVKNKQSPSASAFCNVIPFPFTVRDGDIVYDAPSMSTSILSFSSTYIIYPMMLNRQQNYVLLLFLIVITLINVAVEYKQNCSNIMGLVLGLIVGIVCGILYYTMLFAANQHNLVYFSDTISNNLQCSKPTKQNFKCEFYKNGKPYKV